MELVTGPGAALDIFGSSTAVSVIAGQHPGVTKMTVELPQNHFDQNGLTLHSKLCTV